LSIDTGKSHNTPQIDSTKAGQWAAQTPQRPLSITQGCAEQLIEQYQALGIAHTEAERLLQLSCSALNVTLEDIDSRAFSAAPVADQVSILLPRLDIDKLAELVGISRAQVQSAVAMLTLEYVLKMHFPA
jgi:hypothetical protein